MTSAWWAWKSCEQDLASTLHAPLHNAQELQPVLGWCLQEAEISRLSRRNLLSTTEELRRVRGKEIPNALPASIQHAGGLQNAIQGAQGRPREVTPPGWPHNAVRTHLKFKSP
jgi:hypothetical protein